MGSQFVDLNADGRLDYLSATFDGSPHVSWGGEAGFAEPWPAVAADGAASASAPRDEAQPSPGYAARRGSSEDSE